MSASLCIELRPATEEDVRLLTIIKLSNSSTFAKITVGVHDLYSLSESTIKANEADIRKRLLDWTSLLIVATVTSGCDEKEEIAGWANWKIFDEPQAVESAPMLHFQDRDDEQLRLSKMCLCDFKTALVKGRNTHTVGQRNVREYCSVLSILTHKLS